MSATHPAQSNKSYDITLVFMSFACLAIFITALLFYAEQSKHNHPLGQRQAPMSMENATGKADGDNISNITAAIIPPAAPSIGTNATIPSEIPKAMRDAMEQRGMTMEDLQTAGGTSEIPAEMLAAMQKANKDGTQTSKEIPNKIPQASSAKTILQSDADAVGHAVQHISNDGKPEEKQAVLNSMQKIALDPNDVDAMLILAQTFLNHNEINGTQVFAERAMVTDPSNPEAPYLLGVVFSKKGDFNGALKQWTHALKLQPTAKTHYALAILYRYQLNNAADAKKHLNLANKIPNVDEKLKKHIIDELKK